MSREAIMTALISTISGSTAFATVTRKWQSWQDDPQATIPALPMVVQWEGLPESETIEYSNSRGLPGTQTFHVAWLIYARIPPGLTDAPGVPDKEVSGASVINPLIDVAENGINANRGADGVNTLGGLVSDARIEGVTTKVLGDIDPSGICSAIIPVKILVTK